MTTLTLASPLQNQMQILYSAAQVRELDRLAIEVQGIPSLVLMKRAGRSAFESLLEVWPQTKNITVFCGGGNNAGDGFILAALAHDQGIVVNVYVLVAAQTLKGDAKKAYDYACSAGVVCEHIGEAKLCNLQISHDGVLVDALLGTGFQGVLRPLWEIAIETINQSDLPVLSLDIPSGLHCDSGFIDSVAVQADITVTFIGLKRGLFTGHGRDYCGDLFFDNLDVAESVYSQLGQSAAVKRLSFERLLSELPDRLACAHKGDFGHVLVIGGDSGFGGAALMAAESVLRCGAGLVSLATSQAEHVSGVLARCPEIMAHHVNHHHQLMPLLEQATVLVIGPGLGERPWGEQMFYHALEHAAQYDKPMVIDASGLNLLAKQSMANQLPKQLPRQCILTPHPGEAARLLQTTTGNIQQDRFSALEQLTQGYAATIILKGSGTLVHSQDGTALCPYGNSAMASGGMGDVLSGVLGALLAQGASPSLAAELGVCVHSLAADKLVDDYGSRGIVATDLISVIPELLNGASLAATM